MISNPEHGWCNFNLGEFAGTPSYLTNVPIDLLNCFIEFFNKGTSCVLLDEEGEEFTFILTNYNIYIIHESRYCVTKLFNFNDIKIKDLAKELIKDIEEDFIEWCKWDNHLELHDSKQEEKLKELLNELKKILESKVL